MTRANLRVLLLVVAVVCFAVAWVISIGEVDWTNPTPWGYFGLGFFAGSFLS